MSTNNYNDAELYNKVVQMLKKQSQSLVFLRGIEDTNGISIMDVVGDSKRQMRMKRIIGKLKRDNIVEYASGFMSLSEIPPFPVYTAVKLTKSFAEKHIPKQGVQMRLF